MEADWEVEIGGDAPVIHAHWADFIDLRLEPGRVATLAEVSDLPALAPALLRLNSDASPVWTSKSDVWEQPTFDPDEMDAPPGTAASAIACYIDLLSRTAQEWRVHGQTVGACKTLCRRLSLVTVRSCRIDLVVRRACIAPDLPDHGITVYLTACGSTFEEARSTLGAALVALVDCILWSEDAPADSSKLQ
jgi:hypothetical protein